MNKEKTERIYKVIMLVVLTASITFIVTTVLLYNKVGKETGEKTVQYITTKDEIGKTFQTFHSFIEKNYIGEIDEEKMLESAIKGYVKGLDDEYSEYITKDEMKDYMESTVGKYIGIGVYIANNKETDQIVVLMPIKGSPAEEAGIQSEDIITKVDGVAYKGSQLSEAALALKSKEGGKAEVEILRGEETITLQIERKQIKVSHVESEVLENQIGYIQISSFDDGTFEEFKECWENLKSQNVKALILDLRNNGGGIVDESINIADMFTEMDQTLIIMSEKNNEDKTKKAKNSKQIDVPVAILTNENTASASEILTAAIKENNDNVKVVGKNTYGKGVIQTIFSLSDGSGIKLTTNEYFTPKHNVINKIGIKPDIEVDFPDNKSIYTIEKNEDTQLQKAIEVLN